MRAVRSTSVAFASDDKLSHHKIPKAWFSQQEIERRKRASSGLPSATSEANEPISLSQLRELDLCQANPNDHPSTVGGCEERD
jgi:hypothetical protein